MCHAWIAVEGTFLQGTFVTSSRGGSPTGGIERQSSDWQTPRGPTHTRPRLLQTNDAQNRTDERATGITRRAFPKHRGEQATSFSAVDTEVSTFFFIREFSPFFSIGSPDLSTVKRPTTGDNPRPDRAGSCQTFPHQRSPPYPIRVPCETIGDNPRL